MGEVIFWSGVLRVSQAALQAAPTICVGLLVAGVLRRLLGYEHTRRLFGGRSGRSIVQAWAVGMLLPVCSLGVIPIIRELRKAGVAGGTILAFALSAPLFNPLSLLYGLTLSEPIAVVAFAFCSLVVVTAAGGVWNRLFPAAATSEPEPPKVAPGPKRMASVMVDGAREIAGPSAGYMLLGLAGVVLLAATLPPNSLQTSAEHDNRYAPLLMSAVALPAYTTPMTVMWQLGSMFQHGNSVGAAFALLVLGAGANLGLVVWMVREYGPKRTAVWLGLLVAVVIGLSYGVDRPLRPADVEPAGHTHAFDSYCRPFHAGTVGLAAQTIAKLRQDLLVFEAAAAGALALWLLLGVALKHADTERRIERWLEREAPADDQPVSWYNRPVPGPVLGAVALAGLIALSIVGCYLYYPPPDEVFEELSVARGEALSAALSGDRRQATHWIEICDDWTRRLQVGVYLRDWRLSEYHRMKARLLRDKLERLEHELEHDDRDELQRLVASTERCFQRLRVAYLEER